jgi:hypothetical protein
MGQGIDMLIDCFTNLYMLVSVRKRLVDLGSDLVAIVVVGE